MKKIIFTTTIFVSFFLKTNAQQIKINKITDNLETMRSLSIRPNIAFIIPPLGLKLAAPLPVNINIDAQYWFKKIADIRVGVSFGPLTGGSLGITYHLQDKLKNANHKFVTSRTSNGRTETTRYFKARGDVRKIFGPALDVTLGNLQLGGGTSAFYNRIDIGIDLQKFSRVWAYTDNGDFSSSKNGWTSLKLQGVYASGAKTTGIGAVATLQAAVSPWRTVTLFVGLPMGIMKITNAKPVPGSAIKQDTTVPIFGINFGVAINLIKQK